MKKIEMIENLLNSETFMEAASGIQTLEQLQKLFAQNGVELTMEELKALTASAGAVVLTGSVIPAAVVACGIAFLKRRS